MYRKRISGFSLVELMVAVVIGLIGSVIIFQVYGAFEGQKRSATSGGDTDTNLAIASNVIERAGRQSGFGLNFSTHMGCDVVIWSQSAAPPGSDLGHVAAVKMVPALISRASGNVTLSFVSGGSEDVYSVTQLTTAMTPDSNSNFSLANMYGVNQGDLLILAERKDAGDAARTNKITCAAMQARNIVGTPSTSVDHTYGSYTIPTDLSATLRYTYFNKTGGLHTLSASHITTLNTLLDLPLSTSVTLTSRFTFTSNASVMNVGTPRSSNTLGLRASVFTLNNGQLLENGSPVTDGIVFMEAQYGLAATPTDTSGTVTYVTDMPQDLTKDPHVTQTDWFRLRTVRVVLIARVGNYEKDYIFPASTITVWGPVDPFGNRALTPDLSPNPVTYTVPDLHYRYKVITMVIPIRNMFWKP